MCLLCCGRERDEFDAELTELKKKLAYVETAHESSTHERDDLRTEVSAVLESFLPVSLHCSLLSIVHLPTFIMPDNALS